MAGTNVQLADPSPAFDLSVPGAPIYTQGRFLESQNFSNLFRQMTVTGFLAVGMVLVIVIGGIDLSVGKLAGFVSVVVAVFQRDIWFALIPDQPILAAALSVLVGLAVGALFGMFQAYTGYLLPMDQMALWATQTGMQLLRGLPLGELFVRFLVPDAHLANRRTDALHLLSLPWNRNRLPRNSPRWHGQKEQSQSEDDCRGGKERFGLHGTLRWESGEGLWEATTRSITRQWTRQASHAGRGGGTRREVACDPDVATPETPRAPRGPQHS